MTEMEQWIEFYKSNNLTYFPLYGITNGTCRCVAGATCSNAGKHPRYKWKNQPARMPGALDNVGISTDNLVVIDFDGNPSQEVLAEFPRTFSTSTGHGYHLWYRADPSKPCKSFAGWRHNVDIRAMGGLVVAPPSRHRKGTEYRHVLGDSIQPVPRDLLDSLPERYERRQKIGHEVVPTLIETHEAMQPLGNRLVEDMESASENRNQTLFRLACRYFELAAVDLLGQDVLRELFQAALRSGLTAEECERTITSASRSV